MSTTTIAVLIAFVCYLAMMIGIGIFSMKKTNSTEDYFLGGRGLNSWVAALSAQASDMSGWLLMGLPGSIYLAGTGKAWIAIGLFIGTALNWICISKRLRRYTIVANNSLTLPEFFQNRFRDKKDSSWNFFRCNRYLLLSVYRIGTGIRWKTLPDRIWS